MQSLRVFARVCVQLPSHAMHHIHVALVCTVHVALR